MRLSHLAIRNEPSLDKQAFPETGNRVENSLSGKMTFRELAVGCIWFYPDTLTVLYRPADQ